MADNKPQQQKDNKDAESGEPIQLDKEQPPQTEQQPQQGQPKPQQQGNEAGGMQQGAERPEHEGGEKK